MTSLSLSHSLLPADYIPSSILLLVAKWAPFPTHRSRIYPNSELPTGAATALYVAIATAIYRYRHHPDTQINRGISPLVPNKLENQ